MRWLSLLIAALFGPLAYAASEKRQALLSAKSSTNPNDLQTGYWFSSIRHQGTAPYSVNSSSYVVYRNVKDYGAKGKAKLQGSSLDADET